jgi:phosphate transport system permease protein
MCILSASLLLAVLISPTMILVFSDNFAAIPQETILAAKALGANRVQTFLCVILPCSADGILSGVILAAGRAVGDTMIALMVTGNAIAIPDSILSSARTLTAHIALVIASDFNSLQFKTIFACGITLYVITAAMVVLLRSLPALIRRKP